MSEEKIKKAMPGKRDAMCFELLHAVLIPKGTILRQEPGKPGIFTAPAGYGVFTVTTEQGISHPTVYKRVVG